MTTTGQDDIIAILHNAHSDASLHIEPSPTLLANVYNRRRRQQRDRAIAGVSGVVVAALALVTAVPQLAHHRGPRSATGALAANGSDTDVHLPAYTPRVQDGWLVDGTANRAGVAPNGRDVGTFTDAASLRGLHVEVACVGPGTITVTALGDTPTSRFSHSTSRSVKCPANIAGHETLDFPGQPTDTSVSVVIAGSGFTRAEYRVWVRPL
jgi:hypothetical protein